MRFEKAKPKYLRDQRQIHRIADELEPQLASRFEEALSGVQDAVDLRLLLAAVQRGDEQLVARVIREAHLPRELQPTLGVMTEALVAAAVAHRVPGDAKLSSIGFDVINPRVVDYLREHGAELVTNITDDTLTAMRGVLERSAIEGAPPREVAATLRDMIGLNERQGNALYSYRMGLVEQGVDDVSIGELAGSYADRLLDQRAEMIARTEIIGSANEGRRQMWEQLAERGLIDRGKSLREWSATVGACPICEELDGQQVGFDEPFVTEDGDEYDQPPSHPNSIAGWVPVEGEIIAATRMLYSGQIREIVTANGRTLTITPNHAVATTRGFIPASQIQEGDQLLAYSEGIEDSRISVSSHLTPVSMLLSPQNEQQGPAPIEEVFRTCEFSGVLVRAQRFGHEFHGDAAFGNSDIDVVFVDRELGNRLKPTFLDQGQRFALKATEFPRVSASHVGLCDTTLMQNGVGETESSPVGRLFSVTDPPQTCRIGLTTHLDAVLSEMLADFVTRDASFARELQNRLPGLMSQDQVVEIRDRYYTGHVYDLQTISEVIVASGLVISNCRCAAVLIVGEG